MKTFACLLIGLGSLLALPASIAAAEPGRRWLYAVFAAGSAVSFTGWVLLILANRRGGAR